MTHFEFVQLIYISKATADMGEEDLLAILESAVRHNQQNQVTGVLLYFKGTFVQVIEGPAASIDELMGRLQCDPRHREINVLARSPAERREFPDWSMGFKCLDQAIRRETPHYIPYFSPDFDESALSQPGLAIEIIRELAKPIAVEDSADN